MNAEDDFGQEQSALQSVSLLEMWEGKFDSKPEADGQPEAAEGQAAVPAKGRGKKGRGGKGQRQLEKGTSRVPAPVP